MNAPRPFTGRHISIILVAFFGVVIAVNVTMATVAVRSFGGTVVDNSYVASQEFNRWLRAADAAEKLDWKQEAGLDAGHRLVLRATSAGRPLEGAVSAVAVHPLGRADDIPLRFDRTEPGRYRARAPLPAGRWTVHWTLRANGREKRFVEDIQ